MRKNRSRVQFECVTLPYYIIRAMRIAKSPSWFPRSVYGCNLYSVLQDYCLRAFYAFVVSFPHANGDDRGLQPPRSRGGGGRSNSVMINLIYINGAITTVITITTLLLLYSVKLCTKCTCPIALHSARDSSDSGFWRGLSRLVQSPSLPSLPRP